MSSEVAAKWMNSSLDLLRVVLAEGQDQGVERIDRLAREGLQLGDRRLGGKRHQPAQFDAQPIADQRVLAEIGPQEVGGPCVPAVERRQRGERGCHDTII
jgi:hypothetical protein